MKRFSDRHSLTTLSELNITPLLDLAFVLLIIFMITTPLMENSIELVPPTGGATEKQVDPSAVQTISINRDAEMKLGADPVTIADLERRLGDLKLAKPDIAVVVRSHKELPVQKLVEVLDAVKRVKVGKVGVVTSPEL